MSRKLSDALTSSILLLAGFIVAAKLEADPNLYYAFVAGVIGKTAAFNWGNSKEHEAASKKGAPNAEQK